MGMIIAGNSHVSIFRNRIKHIKSNKIVPVKWVGAITVSHFLNQNSSAQMVKSLFSQSDKWKFLSIGMHDIFKLCNAYAKGRYEQVFEKLVAAYKDIFLELNSKGKLGWLVSPQQLNGPTTLGLSENQVFKISEEFIETLTAWCVENGIIVINPLNRILSKNNFPKDELLQVDGIHLNDAAIEYYIQEINKQVPEDLVLIPRSEFNEIKLQANTEPESLALLVSDELGLPWDQTKLPHGTRRQFENKLVNFISDLLSKKGVNVVLERNSDYNIGNKLSSIDFVEIYTFANDLLGEKMSFDVNIRDLNSVGKMSDFVYRNKMLTKNDFYESLTVDSPDEIRRSETSFADSRIAAMHDDMYLHFKEIIHLQTGGMNFGYGIIYFWFAVIEAHRENYAFALNLLKNSQNLNLRFPFLSSRSEHYRNIWQEKLIEIQNKTIDFSKSNQEACLPSSERISPMWPNGHFVRDEDDLLSELAFRAKEIGNKIEILYAIGVYDPGKCSFYFNTFKRLKKIYFFVPVPEFNNQLRKVCKNDNRIDVFPYALTDSSGYDILTISNNDAGLKFHMGQQYKVVSGKTVSVECRTIGKFVKENNLILPDMIIYNILGMEHRFLKSIPSQIVGSIKINYFAVNQDLFYAQPNPGEAFPAQGRDFSFCGFSPISNTNRSVGHVLFLNEEMAPLLAEKQKSQAQFLENAIPESVLSKRPNRSSDDIDAQIDKIIEELYESGVRLLADGNIVDAIFAFRRTIEICPDHSLAFYKLGMIFWEQKDMNQASICFDKAFGFDPYSKTIASGFVDLLIAVGHPEQAKKVCTMYLRQNPNDKAFSQLLSSLDASHKRTLAVDSREKICQNKETLEKLTALNQQGEDLFSKGDIEGALNTFTKAIEINPNFATAHNNLGVLHLQSGEAQKAIEHFAEALEIDPNDRDTILNCGELFKSLEKIEDARNIYASYLRKNPNDEEITKALVDLKDKGTIEVREVKDEKYLVSAIVSTYNSERFIRGRLQNLVGQTLYKKNQLEIIVIDSNSPQNEREVVEEFMAKYKNIRYLRTLERETVYGAWNRGIQLASGGYVINANTDDRFAIDALDRMANELDSNPNIHAVYGDWLITKVENDTFDSDTNKSVYCYPEFSPPLFFYSQITSHAALLRKDVFEQIGFYDGRLKIFGDRDFMFRFSVYGLKAKKIPYIVGLYLENPNSLERSEKKSYAMESASIYERFLSPEYFVKLFGYDSVPNNAKLAQLYADAGSLGKDLYSFDGKPIGTFGHAARLLVKALEFDDANVMALNNLCIIACLEGKQQQAIQLLEKALQAGQSNRKPEIQANLSVAKRGSKVLDDYLWFKPDSLNYHISVCKQKDSGEGALEDKRHSHRKDFKKEDGFQVDYEHLSIDELLAMGEKAFAEGGLTTARQCFENILHKEPNHLEALNNLAVLDAEHGDYDEAANNLFKALALAPEDCLTRENLAGIYQKQHKYNQAVYFYHKALEQEKNNGDLYANLSLCLLEMGDVEEAQSALNKAKSLDADAQLVDLMSERLASMSKQLRSAAIRKQRIAILCMPGLTSFLDDIVDFLHKHFEVRTCYSNNIEEIKKAIAWADIVWLEWANELAVGVTSKIPDLEQKKVVCRVHSYEVLSGLIAGVDWTKVSKTIFVADHVRRIAIELFPNLPLCYTSSMVIANGVNLSRFSFKERASGFNIAVVGHVNHKKNPSMWIEVMNRLVKLDSRYTLHVAGELQDSRYKYYFENILSKAELENNIKFYGRVDRINEWLMDKNYILSTSVFEGHPYNIMEAMAMGIKPLIHDYMGAEEQWPESCLWTSIDELVQLIRNGEYDSKEYSKFVKENYSMEIQLEKIKKLLLEFSSVDRHRTHDFTVLMKTYNRPQYLEQNIEKGCWNGIQLHIVDDGSEKHVVEKLKAVTQGLGATIDHYEPNKGVAHALGHGIKGIDSRYFMVVDDDDYVIGLDEFYDIARNIMEDQSDILMIPIPFIYATNGTKKTNLQYDRRKINEKTGFDLLKLIVETGEIQALGAGTLFRTEDMRFQMPEDFFKNNEDYMLLVRLCAAFPNHKIIVPSIGQYIRLIHNESTSAPNKMSLEKIVIGLVAQTSGAYCLNKLTNADNDRFQKIISGRGEVLNRVFGKGRDAAYVIAKLTQGRKFKIKTDEMRRTLSFLKESREKLPQEFLDSIHPSKRRHL